MAGILPIRRAPRHPGDGGRSPRAATLYPASGAAHIGAMAILKIARMGHAVLRQPARAVESPTAPEIAELVRDMVETMEDALGTGLAAPQIHEPLRIVIFTVNSERASGEPGDEPHSLSVLINPVIEPLGEERALGWEGCLSIPGMMGAVPRYTRVRYRAVGLDGRPIDRVATGFHARVVQHECDHLDGLLYPMRMEDLRRLGFVDELRRHAPPLSEEAL
jgi:peptide deformylase